MKRQQWSVEALYALIFALCILAALLLLTGCGAKEAASPEDTPVVVIGGLISAAQPTGHDD